MNKSSVNWKWPSIVMLFAIGLWVAFYLGGLSRRQEVLPFTLPTAFALDEKDLPKGYSLMQGTALLEKLGMERNPDYIDNLSEVEALARRGALCSFAAIYGRGDVPALMLNGVFFRSAAYCDRFIEEEQKKDLLLGAYREKVETGIWVFFVACDSELVYSNGEQHQISKALENFVRKYRLETLFNHMSRTPNE